MDKEAIQAYIKAQSEMGAALKKSENPFLKNKYADLQSVQDAVFPAFHQNGFAIFQYIGKDEFGDFVATELAHDAQEDFLLSKCYLQFKNSDMQSYGGAVTYARRYGLLTVSGVSTEDDDGNHAVGHDRMKIKKDHKENRLTNNQAHQLDRALALEAMLTNASGEVLRKFEKEAKRLSDNISEFDQSKGHELWSKYSAALSAVGN